MQRTIAMPLDKDTIKPARMRYSRISGAAGRFRWRVDISDAMRGGVGYASAMRIRLPVL
jgi:hypothetical protein